MGYSAMSFKHPKSKETATVNVKHCWKVKAQGKKSMRYMVKGVAADGAKLSKTVSQELWDRLALREEE